jgi:hypothetical protein
MVPAVPELRSRRRRRSGHRLPIAQNARAVVAALRYDRHMGLLSRILGRGLWRDRGLLAKPPEPDEKPVAPLPQPPPTAGTRLPKRPEPTPTTRPLGGPRDTAGTPRYGPPAGTPSTERIHNPTHLGR